MARRTDSEAIEDIMALRARLETAAQIARLRAQRHPDIVSEIENVLRAATEIHARLQAWHKQAKRRKSDGLH